jgi:DNA ligase D-like protein (predicted ligase)
MKNLFDNLPDPVREKLREKQQPQWTRPMLAKLTHEYFSDENWIFERKLDGERCLAFRTGKDIRLMSRNRKELNLAYPELVDALGKECPDNFIADGEVVAFEGKVTSFARLQKRMHVKKQDEARQSGVAVYYYLFDLLQVEGFDTTELHLRARKSLLKKAFSFKDPLRFLPHRNGQGEDFLDEACRKGWEGIIAKKAQSTYAHKRSGDWLKFKCSHQQEFVVGGYTEPQGERIGFGALLVGYYDEDQLVYAGKVGTGYDDQTLKQLCQRLQSMERKTSPFRGDVSGDKVHWVSAKLVAQVAFTEWTEDGRLRHPRFLGLRRDKEPEEVVRENG